MIRLARYFTQWSYRINPLKTIYFNFKAFPFREAIKFPCLIGYNVIFRNLEGEIIVKKINMGGGAVKN